MGEYFHSVTLDEEKCKGCTNCIKRCPTEAIRVRHGKARIINERCIDCGECIRICPYHAKKAITDDLSIISNYKYKIAIPAPSIYGQFKPVYSRNRILNAFYRIGFDDVYEVAMAAEYVSDATRKLLSEEGTRKPLISSACPAVVRLIQVRFPNLIDNLIKLESPMEVAAKMVKKKTAEKKGIDPSDIGVFFITPCAAKATSVKAPYENKKSSVDGAISIKSIYLKLLANLDKADDTVQLAKAGFEGIRWANSGGEGLAVDTDNFLAVDGIHNVISILEAVENDKIEGIDFIEALACTGGCLGGPLTVENVYVAKTRLKKYVEAAKEAQKGIRQPLEPYDESIVWTGEIAYKPVLKLDTDIDKAIKKLEALEKINDGLPGLDCGACGAPSCRALAEDIVRGIAYETDCIFKLREKVRDLAAQMKELEEKAPPTMG
ncbi:MAG TPA: [Fe-Fe] hydrogenase large subunit C-terminal domain-containing protein [Clostridiales bacterium]|nr:[Fe-Fe] hydrogenase large subunit C-terminal domain-containing protein [Clostridiales bacterium]HPP35280.1 [Fe-Fe] hydrogenase large subunit C-terminal domain-containing protein [Clostridiales bacterium]